MATLFARQALTDFGWMRNVRLTISGGRIAEMAIGAERQPSDDVVAAIVPGMVNLHSHAFQRAFAGLAEESSGRIEDNFWSWRDAMYRYALVLSPDDVEAIAAQLYVEMLEAGFTRVGEFHYLHQAPDGTPYADKSEMAGRIVEASAAAGIGLTLLPVFYAHGGFGGVPPARAQRRFICDIEEFVRLFEGARAAVAQRNGANLGLAPHSLRAVTPDELAAILPMAKGLPIHIHVAEQVKEVEDCHSCFAARPVEWLLANAAVDHHWCLIHATHMTTKETEGMAKSGAVAGLCPITEANLGDGLFNAREFIDAGGAFGVGSDSNVEISPGGELRLLEYGQRLRQRARNVIVAPGQSTGGMLYRRARRGGCQALGQAYEGAGISPGIVADLVTLCAPHPEWPDLQGDEWLDALIFAPGSVRIDHVFSAGVPVVIAGKHVRRDRIGKRFGQTMRRLRQIL